MGLFRSTRSAKTASTWELTRLPLSSVCKLAVVEEEEREAARICSSRFQLAICAYRLRLGSLEPPIWPHHRSCEPTTEILGTLQVHAFAAACDLLPDRQLLLFYISTSPAPRNLPLLFREFELWAPRSHHELTPQKSPTTDHTPTWITRR
jgi:hypothetical protein